MRLSLEVSCWLIGLVQLVVGTLNKTQRQCKVKIRREMPCSTFSKTLLAAELVSREKEVVINGVLSSSLPQSDFDV